VDSDSTLPVPNCRATDGYRPAAAYILLYRACERHVLYPYARNGRSDTVACSELLYRVGTESCMQ
jgi:hypothetical protein